MHELEGLREQLGIFERKGGEIDLGEVEVALKYWRERREGGVEFLGRSEDLEHVRWSFSVLFFGYGIYSSKLT